jgi:FAD/FMN-containing dehydrogenase
VDVDKEIEGQLVQKRLALDYLYLNDAEKGQKVFEEYGKRNVQKMKGIRRKYDPKNVFTELMPGGFKG